MMKTLLLGAALGVAALSAGAQVSVTIGQPGFYGRMDMGGFAPAPLVYGPPVIASGGYYSGAPVYLRVPLYQRRNWGRYCRLYNACGLQVLFVRDDWYANSYIPRYREYYRRGGPGWRGDPHPGYHHGGYGGGPGWGGGYYGGGNHGEGRHGGGDHGGGRHGGGGGGGGHGGGHGGHGGGDGGGHGGGGGHGEGGGGHGR